MKRCSETGWKCCVLRVARYGRGVYGVGENGVGRATEVSNSECFRGKVQSWKTSNIEHRTPNIERRAWKMGSALLRDKALGVSLSVELEIGEGGNLEPRMLSGQARTLNIEWPSPKVGVHRAGGQWELEGKRLVPKLQGLGTGRGREMRINPHWPAFMRIFFWGG